MMREVVWLRSCVGLAVLSYNTTWGVDQKPDTTHSGPFFVFHGYLVCIEGTPAIAWRAYAKVGVGNKLVAVFGDATNPLSILTEPQEFYQHPLGGVTEPNQALIDLFPDLCWDTYLTIGNPALDPGETATGLSPFFPSGDPDGEPWEDGPLESTNGSWFRTPDDPLTQAGSDGLVMLGQFTIFEGDLSGLVNIAQVIGGQAVNEEGLILNPTIEGFDPCRADLNDDGLVEVLDLNIVLQGWGVGGGDATGDGLTDVLDLIAVINNWGDCGCDP